MGKVLDVKADDRCDSCKDENGISGAGWKFGIGAYVLEWEQTWEPMG